MPPRRKWLLSFSSALSLIFKTTRIEKNIIKNDSRNLTGRVKELQEASQSEVEQ